MFPAQGPQNHNAKAKKVLMCSISLIAIELRGLAAPGEALKNLHGQAGASCSSCIEV